MGKQKGGLKKNNVNGARSGKQTSKARFREISRLDGDDDVKRRNEEGDTSSGQQPQGLPIETQECYDPLKGLRYAFEIRASSLDNLL